MKTFDVYLWITNPVECAAGEEPNYYFTAYDGMKNQGWVCVEASQVSRDVEQDRAVVNQSVTESLEASIRVKIRAEKRKLKNLLRSKGVAA